MKIPIMRLHKEGSEVKAEVQEVLAGPWQRISKIAIYLLVFLLPLWILPLTVNVLDFQKQALLGILVFLALLAWLLKILVSGKLELSFSFLNIPVLVLFFIYGLATFFSVFRYGSFWGWPLNVGAGFLTLIFFFFLYFLISHIFARKEDTPKFFWFLFALAASGFLASLFAIFQFFGKFLLPWDFTKINSFNTIGTVNSLAVFVSCLLPLTVALIFIAKKLFRLALIVFALAMITVLILTNFWVAWACLIVGMAIIFVFSLISVKQMGENWWLLLPMALLTIALLFISFKFSLPGLPPGQIEVSPSYGAELSIAKSALSKGPILGTGPGTFIYDFSKYKSPKLNQTLFWNTRFGSGSSEILDKLITFGILGILALFFVFSSFLWLGFKYLRQPTFSEKNNWLMTLGISASFCGVILSQFLYPANFSLNFLFWLFLGGLAVFGQKMKTWTLEPASPLTISVSFFLVLIIIFGIGLIFLGSQKYLAEVKYLQGLRAWQKGESETAVNYLTAAINLNPNLDTFWRDAAQLYLLRLNETLQNPKLSAEEKSNQGQVFVSNAINSAKQATDLNPQNVANWNVRGFVYRNMIGLVGGAEDWALSGYEKAAELEPANPYIFGEMGLVYLNKIDVLKNEAEKTNDLNKAREKFQQATELKPDYAPAHFQLAMISVREGKIKEAIEKLESLKSTFPFDTGLGFQVGLLYYNDKQMDKAKTEFQRVLLLDTNYANARYFLGLIYDQEGKREDAIAQFEGIEKLNPDNEEIKKILTNLRAGKPALEGVVQAQPPIEEKPPERLEKPPEKQKK